MSEDEKSLLQQEQEKRKIQDKQLDLENDKGKKRNPWDSQPCGLCRAVKSAAKCKGHGGGGGSSGGGGGSSEKAENSSLAPSSSAGAMTLDGGSQEAAPSSNAVTLDGQSSATSKDVDPTLVAKLLSDNTLKIDDDRQNGKLSISIDPNKWYQLNHEDKQQVQMFFKIVLDEFFKYYDNLSPAEQSKFIYNFKTDQENKNILSLEIETPSLELYNNFMNQLTGAIQRLSNENTSPAVNFIASFFQDIPKNEKDKIKSDYVEASQNSAAYESDMKDKNTYRSPTALPTKPTPKGANKIQDRNND